MRISILTIGAFASIIAINSVFADTTVTSKQYVDTEVAKKQNIIETGLVSVDANTQPLSAVVSYDTENDIVGNEYGILTQEIVEDWGVDCSTIHCNFDSTESARFDRAIPTVTAVKTALEQDYNMLQAEIISLTRKVCAGWPDDIPVAQRNNTNCWLWYK